MVNELAVGTAGRELAPPPRVDETRTVAKVLTDDVGYYRKQARDLHADFNDLHQKTRWDEWVQRTTERGRAGVPDMLRELADLGFAWRDIAQLVGVSVPAIQKWRRGEGTTGENRQKVARLLAACDLITDHYLIQDVASWFEMPIQMGVPVTPIDLWAGGRPDLVLDCASEHTPPLETLNAWDPNWRDRYRSDFEVFRAEDGQRSIRPKER